MKLVLVLASLMMLGGCATTPYEELNLDTTSNFKIPEQGKAGVYAYQWKKGVIGAIVDVDFKIKGLPEVSLNTGEYTYYELEPGDYEYLFSGGLIKQYAPVTFEAGQNYFFRAFLLNLSDHAALVRDQEEIEDVKVNILSGRYEHNSVD